MNDAHIAVCMFLEEWEKNKAMMITCDKISKSYKAKDTSLVCLKEISFGLCAQEFLGIVGPNGCGKTTLLKILGGILSPTSGKLLFDTPEEKNQPFSAMVFQNHGLFPWMTVLENVVFGLEMRGVSLKERKERGMCFLQNISLASFANYYPDQLSLGMRQQVAILRAFVTDPCVLLMDEPFASVDAQIKRILHAELLRIWESHQKSVVYVTHDIEEAIFLSDRILVMSSRPGKILCEIPVPLTRPRKLSGGHLQTIAEIKYHIWELIEKEVTKSWNPLV